MQNKLVIAITATAFGLSLATPAAFGGSPGSLGFTELQNELGPNTPTGAGIGVTQVEAGGGGDGLKYLPDDPASPGGDFANDVINDVTGTRSGESGEEFYHARSVGGNYYGSDSFAPGAGNSAAHPVDVYQASDWFYGVLSPFGNAPLTEDRRVQNHSYVIRSTQAIVVNRVRRADRQFERDNVIAAAGVDNSSNSSIPGALSTSYNAIAVGNSEGDSSLGPVPSGNDGPGRVKPDIVAGTSATSFDTPRVSATAALLLETADGMAQSADAGRLETIKATLLSGATKDEFDLNGSTPETADDWNQVGDEPLDRRYGAGELHVANSYHTLTAGQHEASDNSLVSSTGWDYDNLSQGGDKQYFFDVPDGQTAQTLSITATWNREFPTDDFSTEGLLANLDLELFEVDDESFTLGSLIDDSVSDIDNVEHIFQTDLGSGRYAIELSRDLADTLTDPESEALASGDFGLAWQAQLIPEPTSLAGFAIVGLLVLPRRRRGRI